MSDVISRGGKLCLWIGIVALAACGDSSMKPSAETETHFLQACEDSCGGGLSCICGVCTEACTETRSCAALSPTATCAATPDACESEVAMACAAGESGAGGTSGQGAGGVSSQGADGSVNPEAYSVALQANDTTLCPGQCAILLAVVDNGVEPFRYAWSGVQEDGPQVEVCPTATTTYEVAVTDSTSTLEEFGDDQEASSSLELVVDPDCEDDPPPVGDIVPTCELRIPHSRPNGLGFGTSVESQALMTTDSEGNVLLGGSFSGTIDFGDDVTATALGFGDGFVLKLSPNCEPLWVVTYGGASGSAGIAGIAMAEDDEIYAIGTFGGTIDFGDGAVTTPSTERTSAAVLKLDSSGGLIWKRVYASAGISTATLDLGVTDSGDLIFGGYTGPDTDFGGGPIGGTQVSSTGIGFVARLSSAGDHQYSYPLSGCAAHSTLAVHGSGLTAVSGVGLVSPELAGEAVMADPENGHFIAWLDDAGTLLRSKSMPLGTAPPGGMTRARDESGRSVVYGSDRSLYYEEGSIMVEQPGVVFDDFQRIIKLDANDNEVFTVERAFIGDDVAGFYGGLALDSQGNIIHIDEISEDAYVDGQPIAGPGSHDVYVEKLDPTGRLIWSRTLGATTHDRTWAQAIDLRDALWVTYVEAGQYNSPSSITVITKLAPDTDLRPGSTE